jgi:outer membrane lipoprotein SlyB
MKKIILVAAAAGLAVPAAPVLAHDTGYRHSHRVQDGVQYWQGQDGRYYCKRSNGTVGLLVGGAAGALIGRAIDTRGERATGTILGAAAGALLGREVQKSRSQARCR